MDSFYSLFGSRPDLVQQVFQTISRLVLAAFLGGAIGLERELKRKPAGLRTQMFICFGSAFFTILSGQIAGQFTGDHTRIAAQIIPGIGFIGAGSILHSRGSVSGLTTAATLFVVASIGMAAGGGFHWLAIFATILVLLSLLLLGWVETRFRLKPLMIQYRVSGRDGLEIMNVLEQLLVEQEQEMRTVHVSRVDSVVHVRFTVEATRREHELLFQVLRAAPELQQVEFLGTPEVE